RARLLPSWPRPLERRRPQCEPPPDAGSPGCSPSQVDPDRKNHVGFGTWTEHVSPYRFAKRAAASPLKIQAIVAPSPIRPSHLRPGAISREDHELSVKSTTGFRYMHARPWLCFAVVGVLSYRWDRGHLFDPSYPDYQWLRFVARLGSPSR